MAQAGNTSDPSQDRSPLADLGGSDKEPGARHGIFATASSIMEIEETFIFH
jgi:hypothetical protein